MCEHLQKPQCLELFNIPICYLIWGVYPRTVSLRMFGLGVSISHWEWSKTGIWAELETLCPEPDLNWELNAPAIKALSHYW